MAIGDSRPFTNTDLEKVKYRLALSPLYEVTIDGVRSFQSLLSIETAMRSSFSAVKVGELVLEVIGSELRLRVITPQEVNEINSLAPKIAISK